MRTKFMLISCWMWWLMMGVALATSYCAIFPWGKQCDYVTYDECVRAAGSQGGCEINPQEDEASPGTAPFCLVTSSGSQCIYDDAPACRMAAAIQNSRIVTNAECLENPNR
jgi:hypothetical protein